ARRGRWASTSSRSDLALSVSQPSKHHRAEILRPTVGDRKDRTRRTMAKVSKNRAKVVEIVDVTRKYSVEEAASLVKKAKFAKFDETVDIAVRLGVNPKHADQMVRGA